MKGKYKHILKCKAAETNRGLRIQDLLEVFSLQDISYTVANVWDYVDKSQYQMLGTAIRIAMMLEKLCGWRL